MPLAFFIEEIDNTLELICQYPERWRNPYKNFHELSLKKYPFAIVYFIDESTRQIIVTSIYHQKRNPKKKYNQNISNVINILFLRIIPFSLPLRLLKKMNCYEVDEYHY